LEIGDKDLTNAIYKSLVTNELSQEIITVFPNRYIILTENGTSVFSFKYASYKKVVTTKCKKFQVQYTSTKINGLICKTSYISGLRYNIKCGIIELELMPINEIGDLETEIQCKT